MKVALATCTTLRRSRRVRRYLRARRRVSAALGRVQRLPAADGSARHLAAVAELMRAVEAQSMLEAK